MAPLRPARPTPLAIALWLQIHRGDEGFLRNVRLAEPAPSVHVDAAAYAALRALDRGEPGLFNIADPSGEVSPPRAIAEFGWCADFRIETD